MKKKLNDAWVNENLIKVIVSVFLVFFCSIQPLSVEASETNEKPLKVGWYNWGITNGGNVDKPYKKYIREYFERLEAVTGLKFDYNDNNTLNAKTVVEDEQMDIVFGVPYSTNIAEKYAYIDSHVFDARTSIYRLRNKDEILEKKQELIEKTALEKSDYSYLDLKNKKIAIIIGSKENALKMIEDKTGVKANYLNLIKYNTIEDAQQAVINNRADYLFCLAIFTNMDKFKEACPLVEKKAYLLTKYENEKLIEKITYGLQVIKNENSNYNNWLFKKVKNNDNNEICFTSSEEKALNSFDKLIFYVNKNEAYYYSKDENGFETGYYANYIKNIATRLHKKYQIIPVDPLKISKEKVPGLYCDVVTNYKLAKETFGSSDLTKPTLSAEVLLCVDRSNINLKPGMIYAGDIPSVLESLTSDKSKTIITKNSFEALDLLIEHKADVAVVNSMLTNYVNGLTQNKNIVIASIKPNIVKSMLAVNSLDHNLLTAIDKAIYFITDDDIRLYVEQENEAYNYVPTLFEQINLNFNNFLLVVFVAFILIIYTVKRLMNSNQKIANLANKIEEENSIKDKFLSRISHDIRNPLNVVINYSKFGIEENKKGTTNHGYFKKIIINAEELLKFMKMILELQRINNKIEIQKHVIELCELEKVIRKEFETLAIAKKIEFEIVVKCADKSCYIKGNLKMIKQIIFTLLENAFKYTGSGGRVFLSIETFMSEFGILEKYTISDNGKGISQEFQKKMYDYFNVEDEKVNKESKIGLGLSICKKTVEKLGGKIECDSKIGMGTTFVVSIKEEKPRQDELEKYLVEKENEKTLKESREKRGKSTKPKVLVCEDSIINAKIVKRILESANYESDWAENGEIAVYKVKNTDYDLILMDFKMPVMNGFEASKAIRKFNKYIPIIGLSGSVTEDNEKALRSGMNECIEKPIDKKQLVRVVESFTN